VKGLSLSEEKAMSRSPGVGLITLHQIANSCVLVLSLPRNRAGVTHQAYALVQLVRIGVKRCTR
jgi:hypothetical protein